MVPMPETSNPIVSNNTVTPVTLVRKEMAFHVSVRLKGITSNLSR
jgi:hypothetical protein